MKEFIYNVVTLVEILQYLKKYPCDIVRRAIEEHLVGSNEWNFEPVKFLKIAHNHKLLKLEVYKRINLK